MAKNAILSIFFIAIIQISALSEVTSKTIALSDGSYRVTLYDEGKEIATKLYDKDDKLIGIHGHIPDGIIKEYYNNNKVWIETNYIVGKKDGLEKRFYNNGNIQGEWNYKDDELSGPFKSYYKNGNLFSDLNYKKGLLDGLQRQYYENGILQYEWDYKDGKKDGLYKEFYDDGTLKREFFIDEKPFGSLTIYWIASIVIFIIILFFLAVYKTNWLKICRYKYTLILKIVINIMNCIKWSSNIIVRYRLFEVQDDFIKHYCLAIKHRSVKKFDIAIKEFKICQGIKPNNFQPYLWLTDVYLSNKQIQEAEYNINKALEIVPESITGIIELARVKTVKKEYVDAINILIGVIEKDNKNAIAYRGLGYLYFITKEYLKAEEYLFKGLELDITDDLSYYYLAEAFLGQKEYEKALIYYERYIGCFPKSEFVFNAKEAIKKLQS